MSIDEKIDFDEIVWNSANANRRISRSFVVQAP